MENVPNEIIYKIFDFSPGYLLECVFRHVNSLWNYLCDIALKRKREYFGKYLLNGTYRISKVKKKIESNTCICSCHATLSKVDRDNRFTPRYKQSSCYHNGSIYIFGGQTQRSLLNDLLKLNLIDKRISKILYNKYYPLNGVEHIPCPRSSSSLLSLPSLSGDKLVLFGGYAVLSTPFKSPIMSNRIHLFDVKTEEWEAINPFDSFPELIVKSCYPYDVRFDYVDELKIDVFGKWLNSDPQLFSEFPALCSHPPPTAGHSAALCELEYCPKEFSNSFAHFLNDEKGRFMLIFGGLCSPGPYSSNSLWVFDFQNWGWSKGPIIHSASEIERSDDNENIVPSMGPMSRFDHFDALMVGPNRVDWLIVGGISNTGYKYMDAWLLRTNGLYPSSLPRSSDPTDKQPAYYFYTSIPSYPKLTQQHAGWYWVEVRIKNCFSEILQGSDAGVSLSSKTNSIDYEALKSPRDNTLVDVPSYWPSNLWSRSSAYLKHQKLLVTFATSPRTLMTDDKIEISSLITFKPNLDRRDDVPFNKRRKLGLFLHDPVSEGSTENTSSAHCQSSSHGCPNNEQDSIRNLDRLSPNNLTYSGTGYETIDISTSITNSSPLPPTATTTTTTLTQKSTNDDNSSPSSSTNNNAVVNNLTNLFNETVTAAPSFTNNPKHISERMKSPFMHSTSSAPEGVETTTSALLSHHDQTQQEQIPSALIDNNTTANNLNCHCPCNKSNKSASTPGPAHLNHAGTSGAEKCLSSRRKQQENGAGKRLNRMDMFYLDLKPLEQALVEFDSKNNLTTGGKCRRLIQTTDLPILQWRLSPRSSNKITTLPGQQNSMISEFVPSINSSRSSIPETIFYSLLSTDEECQLALLGGARIHIPAIDNYVPVITADNLKNDIFLID